MDLRQQVIHRIRSSKLVDRLYIIDEGVITQQGSPASLALADNLFSRSLADIKV